jgi:predicted dithiol-disulfide oxidoreductase (DUF899 family)
LPDHTVGTRGEWQAARDELLQREKEHTRRGDELARQRRELPWVAVEKEYRFEADDGPRTLEELFAGRSQLLVYHFMFGPSYEAGCPVCSSSADAVNGVLAHLNARDARMVYVSRAPLHKLQAYKRRMGWSFPWVSSGGNDFSFDFGFAQSEEASRQMVEPMLDAGAGEMVVRLASDVGTDPVGFLTEAPGFMSFVLEDGVVYHTYSTTARGLEFLMGYYPILDRAPKGRAEQGDQHWLRRHDEYGAAVV